MFRESSKLFIYLCYDSTINWVYGMINKVFLYLLEKRNASIQELTSRYRIARETILDYIRSLGDIVVVQNDHIIVSNPILMAVHLLSRGLSFKKVARHLTWKDFEEFTAEILKAHGYSVIRNLRLTRPVRLEIDVIGIDPGSRRGLIIDCKHWARGISRSVLKEIACKHLERTTKFIRYISWAKPKYPIVGRISKVYPIIVTLTTPIIRVVDNVLIVSIQEFNQFLVDLPIVIDTYGVSPLKIGQASNDQ